MSGASSLLCSGSKADPVIGDALVSSPDPLALWGFMALCLHLFLGVCEEFPNAGAQGRCRSFFGKVSACIPSWVSSSQ